MESEDPAPSPSSSFPVNSSDVYAPNEEASSSEELTSEALR